MSTRHNYTWKWRRVSIPRSKGVFPSLTLARDWGEKEIPLWVFLQLLFSWMIFLSIRYRVSKREKNLQAKKGGRRQGKWNAFTIFVSFCPPCKAVYCLKNRYGCRGNIWNECRGLIKASSLNCVTRLVWEKTIRRVSKYLAKNNEGIGTEQY